MKARANLWLCVGAATLFSLAAACAGSSLWSFNELEGRTAFDSTGARPATVHGDPEWVEGPFGRALRLDGDGDYLDVGRITGLDCEQTKMMWILPIWMPEEGAYLIDEGAEGNNNWIELYDAEGCGRAQLRAGFDSFNHVTGKAAIGCGQWYHVAVVSLASGEIAIYVNGALDVSQSGLTAGKRPGEIVIGTDSATRTGCFAGLIDEVSIHGVALSPGQIRQAYQAGLARYRDSVDGTRAATSQIEQTIAETQKLLARLEVIQGMTAAALRALANSGAYDYRSNAGSEMITVRQKLRASMMHVNQAAESLGMSIAQLEGVLRKLESEPPAGNTGSGGRSADTTSRESQSDPDRGGESSAGTTEHNSKKPDTGEQEP